MLLFGSTFSHFNSDFSPYFLILPHHYILALFFLATYSSTFSQLSHPTFTFSFNFLTLFVSTFILYFLSHYTFTFSLKFLIQFVFTFLFYFLSPLFHSTKFVSTSSLCFSFHSITHFSLNSYYSGMNQTMKQKPFVCKNIHHQNE